MAQDMKTRCFLVTLLLALVPTARPQSSTSEEPGKHFGISDDLFWKDGEPFRIFGGDIHYFRIHPEYWRDRLLRAKALGLNTIQTYIPWNMHEPREGEFYFEGMADLESFLQLAQNLDLLVMLRIGPYICAEWDLGGLPAWLLACQPRLQLRSSDPAFLNLVDKWWNVLLPKVVPFMYGNGGPVIMVQVENELGSYSKDTNYLKHLVYQARLHLGQQIILYTTDGGSKDTLENGTLLEDDVYAAVDFPVDWDAAQVFALQKQFNLKGKSPALISEFYTGWLSHWGESLSTTSSEQTAAALDKILSLNASAVLYMAHGGTNFGFYSGANTGRGSFDYKADITSYDYDAPIGEGGDIDHAKFSALRTVLAKHSHLSLPQPPSLPSRTAYGSLHMQKLASLLNALNYLSVPRSGTMMHEPCTMESLNQISGFILYETVLPTHTRAGSILHIPKVHDRAQVFVLTKEGTGTIQPCYIGHVERWSRHNLSLPSHASSLGSKLQILVENMGRVNYGPFLYDPKGILSSVFIDGLPIYDWTVYSIPLDNISSLKLETNCSTQALASDTKRQLVRSAADFACGSVTETFPLDIGLYSGLLHIEASERPADTFLSMKGWSKGVAFLNGFNLGRYWTSAGPQCTLYVPAPILHTGDNELIVLELEQSDVELNVEFLQKHDFTCGPPKVDNLPPHSV